MSDFSFTRFVEDEKAGRPGRSDAARYAYAADVAMMRGFSRIAAVEHAASALVRTNKELMRGQLLGQGVKVGPKQFPRLYGIAQHCAKVLSVPVPQIYVLNSPVVNAYTFGTEDQSFIVLHSALVDSLSHEELTFVIGHETGHIQNKHVVYGTVLIILSQMAQAVTGFIVEPALLPLRAWYRRAEITCDRAGLLCSRSVEAGTKSFMKLAVGSSRLFDEMDVDAYVEQLEEGRATIGRYLEAFQTHPYLPKRIAALRAFAESEIYKSSIGETGGVTIDDVDDKTSQIIRIDGKS
jgi:Zn-dependent protease with chaperone function